MRYAVCYKGISYKPDYSGHRGSSVIDFAECIPSHKEHLINPLLDAGHDVDIFFNTYKSQKVNDFIEEMSPVSVSLTDFDDSIKAGNAWWQYKIIENSLDLTKEYQDLNNVKYDFVIVVRFDTMFLQDFSNIWIPHGAVSLGGGSSDDTFLVISGEIFESVREVFSKAATDVLNGWYGSIHMFPDRLKEVGIECHMMFGGGQYADIEGKLCLVCPPHCSPGKSTHKSNKHFVPSRK
jgi:hypothetical protein